MKKIIYGSIAVLTLIGFIVYGFISAPKVITIDREFEATAYKLKSKSYTEPVTLSLQGVFDEKSKSYLGKIKINTKEYSYCRVMPESIVIMCNVDEAWLTPVGQVYASEDFKAWSLKLSNNNHNNHAESDLYNLLNQGGSTDPEDDIIITLSATGREAALEEFERLWHGYGDRMAEKMK